MFFMTIRRQQSIACTSDEIKFLESEKVKKLTGVIKNSNLFFLFSMLSLFHAKYQKTADWHPEF